MHVASGHIARRVLTWVLLESGLDPGSAARDFVDQQPATHRLSFQRLADEEPAEAAVTFTPQCEPWQVGVTVRTEASWLAERMETLLASYAATGGGSYRDEAVHREQRRHDGEALDRALAANGLPPIAADRRARRIDPATARVLKEVYERNHGHDARLAVLFALQAPKTPKPVKRELAAWLIERFPLFEHRRLRGEIGGALVDLAGVDDVDRLVALIDDERLGPWRGVLLSALLATKTPAAASVLVRHLQGPLRLEALAGLQKLGRAASDHAPAVASLLGDADAEVRRSARRTLRALVPDAADLERGRDLATSKRAPPEGYEEWSTNLDLGDLNDALRTLGSHLDSGLGEPVANAIVAVAERLRVDQSRRFELKVTIRGVATDVFLTLVLDDVDSLAFYIFAPPPVLEQMQAAWKGSHFDE